MTEPAENPEEEALVAEHNACPQCGEKRIDWLVWQDDERVKCSTCGEVYAP